MRTAEAVFGGRKSENIISSFEGIREDSDTSSVKLIILKINYTSPVFAFSVCAFLASPQRGEIKSFGVFDFVAQGVQAYVVRRNRTQKKRKHLTLCRNPSGFRPHNQNTDYTKAPSINTVFAFSVRTILADPNREEIKKMQKRRKSSRRRTSVRQRRFSAVEKAKTLFHLLKESARIPTSFRNSDYTKAVIKKLVFAFSVCAFLASTKAYFISMSVSSHISGASYPSRLTVVAATSESPNSPLSSLTVYLSAVKLS